MAEYVRFLDGGTSATMRNSEWPKYVELTRSETPPGEGWWPVEKVLPKPVVPAGDELAYSYTVRNGTAYKEYTLASRMNRTFSKLRVISALMAANVWPQVKAFIEQSGLYDLYLAAQDFAEGNQFFEQGKAALQAELGWTDEQVEAILAASVKEEP
jgi:hypothetical protein